MTETDATAARIEEIHKRLRLDADDLPEFEGNEVDLVETAWFLLAQYDALAAENAALRAKVEAETIGYGITMTPMRTVHVYPSRERAADAAEGAQFWPHHGTPPLPTRFFVVRVVAEP